LLFCLGLAGSSLAGDLASPAQMLKAGQFSLGVTGTWQSEQKFKDSDLKANTLYSDGVREITSTKLSDFKIKDDQFYLATLTYGLSDCLNIYARAGLAAGGKEEYTVHNPARSAAVGIKLKDAFTWGLGAKGRLFETPGGLGATLSVQYLRYDSRKEENITVDGAPLPLDTFDYQAEYQQVDLVAALYQRIGCFVPYVGLGYEWAQFKYSGSSSLAGDFSGSSDFSSTNQDNLAALLGLDVALGSNFTLNLQGSLVSQSAVSLGLTYLF
jgi:opacity protein-like surface antigen